MRFHDLLRLHRYALLGAAMTGAICLAACESTPDPRGAGDGDTEGCEGGKCDELDGDEITCRPEDQNIALTPMFGGVRFTQPVAMLQAPGDDDSFYVVEKRGVVWRLPTANAGGSDAELVIDFRSRVNSEPNEAGLLGMAFHPDFDQNGEVFFSYTAPSFQSPADLQSRISRLVSRDGGETFDASSEQVLLDFEQPFINHNGGHIEFGPDGMLYAGFGDGGSAGDPQGNGQNPNTLMGTILRLDVDGGFPYRIPSSNPFASGGGRGEIFAWGLRNPWRFHFDSDNGTLWAGDVGQNRFEEIDIIERGGNYGWDAREGAHCFGGGSCNGNFIDPVAEYGRTLGISVTGGFVYRGDDLPALRGTYLYADFGSGRMWALHRVGQNSFQNRQILASGRNIASFAQDHDGELYAVDHVFGAVFKVTDGGCDDPIAPDPDPVPEPQAAADYTFLSRDGVGSEADALAYYEKIAPDYEVGVTSVVDFENDFMAGQKVTGFYKNDHELAKWREMVCTERIGRGVGGCFVRNWDSQADFSSGTGPGGTVGMNISSQGFVRFYSFDEDGLLSTTAVLDSEGPKFVPQVCTTCHNGQYLGAAGTADLGAIFREFEPSTLIRRSGISEAGAESEWLSLNAAIFAANQALRSQSEGGPLGIDHSKQAMSAYVAEIYASFNPVQSRPVDDPEHVPDSWKGGADAAIKAELWQSLVNPYCMTCHRNNRVDFARFADFAQLGPDANGQSVLRQYVDQNPANPGDLIAMPQAEPLFEKLQNDSRAQAAIDAWIGGVQSNGLGGKAETDVAIPDNNPQGGSSTIFIEGGSSVSVSSLSVRVDIRHSFRGDLRLLLTSPSGTTREIAAFDPNDGNDDVVGTLSPGGFGGQDPAGTWRLTVIDRAAQDTGTLRRWTLGINGPAPQ